MTERIPLQPDPNLIVSHRTEVIWARVTLGVVVVAGLVALGCAVWRMKP